MPHTAHSPTSRSLMPRVQENVFHLNPHRLPRPDDAISASRPIFVPVNELLTPLFVSRHTRFLNFTALLSASEFSPDQIASLEGKANHEWEAFIRRISRFSDWSAMLKEARGEWIMQRLGVCTHA